MMYPRGENVKDPHDPEVVAHAELVQSVVQTLSRHYTQEILIHSKLQKVFQFQ